MTKAKTKSKPKPAKPEKEETVGYKTHKPESRKGKIHALFDSQGAEAAFVLGQKLKLKTSTLHSWFGSWRRAAGKSAAKKAKPAPKENKPEPKPVEPTQAVVH